LRGINAAPCESKLKIFEVIVDLIIVCLMLIHYIIAGKKAFNDAPLQNYWILCDLIILILSLPYTLFCQIIMVKGEVTKNMYTLYQIQKRKLEQRR